MNSKINLLVFSILLSVSLQAQKITLDKIWGGFYQAKFLWGINSMNDGEHYSIQERDGIYKYAYNSIAQTNSKGELLVAGLYEDYKLSEDQNLVLVLTESMPVYRHSVKGKWKVYDLQTQKFTDVFEGKLVQEPTFSPDGKNIAFAHENNLYIQNLQTGTITQITKDGKQNHIINGICDWVYEEEFGFVRHFDWNADGTALAFVKFDESQVREFYIPIYEQNLYPYEMRFKYPKAGEENSKVSLHIYDLKANKTSNVNLSSVENYYIPKIKFTQKANTLAVLTSNRHQNKVDVNFVDIATLKVQKLFSETDKAWIETDDLTLEFLKDNSFVWASERDGNKHFYHYDTNGKLKNQITKGDWEISSFYGVDETDQTLYFQANLYEGKRISTEKHIFKINLNGKNLTQLSTKKGTNSADFSNNYKYFILTHSAIDTPTNFVLANGKKQEEMAVIVENSQLKSKTEADQFGIKELIELDVAGKKLNAFIIKPKDFDPNKKYPVLMYQYSGPGSQEVKNSWYNSNDQWHFMLAQNGYLVVCVDGRGTGGKGAAFKKQTYMDLGKLEVEDQIESARAISKLEFVDASRIGIWGWSYGGYMSSNCLFRGGDIFKMAIAVAPVTNWRYYDTVYTERFMRTPQENPEGYDKNSPITYANLYDDKRNKFLLVHGTADDNVHVQNAMDLASALIHANKQFDMMIYPDKNHGIYGGKTRLQLYTLMTNYVLNNL